MGRGQDGAASRSRRRARRGQGRRDRGVGHPRRPRRQERHHDHPHVFATGGDPEGTLVASIARPGGNVTGLSLVGPELVARQLQLLKEAVPKASRGAVLSNPDNPYTATMVKEVETAARSLKVRTQLVEWRGGAAPDAAFDVLAKERPNALLVLFDPVLTGQRVRIAELANKHRLPSMYPHREY